MYKLINQIIVSSIFVFALSAKTQTVIEVGVSNDYEKYPLLSKLCLDVYKGGGKSLSLGTVVVSPMEIFELVINCGVDLSNTKKGPITNLDITPTRTFIKGAQTYRTDEKVRDIEFQLNQVKGKPELIIAVNGWSTATVLRYILKLNSKGQPVNEKNHYEGTIDPSELASQGESPSLYNSGIFSSQSEEDSAILCGILGDCEGKGQRQFTVSMGPRLYASLTLALGWLSTKYPTNSDLDRAEGRVDFQKALAELKKLVEDKYRTSEETAKLVKEAGEKLSRVE